MDSKCPSKGLLLPQKRALCKYAALKLSHTMLLEEFLNVPEENINYKITDSHELVYFLTAINQAITDIDNLYDSEEVLAQRSLAWK